MPNSTKDIDTKEQKTGKASPLKIVIPYLIVSVAWILFSDTLLHQLVTDVDILSSIQTYKGLSFVCMSAGLLYYLSKNNIRAITEMYHIRLSQERLYRTLIDNSNDIVVLSDGKGQSIFSSGNTAQIVGHTAEDFKTLNIYDYIHPDDVVRARKTIAEVIAHPGRIFHEEYRFRHKHGHYIWLESTFVSHLEDATIGGIVSNTRDISARKKSEELIFDNEMLFRSAFEQAVVGMAIINSRNKKRIVNRKYCELTGYSEAELLSLPPEKIIYEADRAMFLEVRDMVFNGTSDGYDIECRLARKDGAIIWAEQTMHVMKDQNDRPVYFTVITRDINDRKLAEAALSYKTETGDEKANVYFDYFYDVAFQLEKVLDNLMAVTQIRQNDVTIMAIELQDLLTQLVQKNLLFDTLSNGNLTMDICPDLILYSDPLLLRTILNAVIENAVIFRKGFDEPNKVCVWATKDLYAVHIGIRDNGRGIPYDEQDKVFDLFFRGKYTERGSGIGLYVAKSAVEKLHGSITMSSTPSEGTEVVVTIPNIPHGVKKEDKPRLARATQNAD